MYNSLPGIQRLPQDPSMAMLSLPRVGERFGTKGGMNVYLLLGVMLCVPMASPSPEGCMRAQGSQSHQVAHHLDRPTLKVGNELTTMPFEGARQGNPTDKGCVAIPLWKKC